MGKIFATCGHDITDYPLGWPGIWTKGWHSPEWSFSSLCFPCIVEAQREGCQVQYYEPDWAQEQQKGATP